MLVRKLTRGGEWKKILVDDPDVDALNLPGELLAEFLPTASDKQWLSLYRVSEESHCADVAAALSFLLRPVNSSEQIFISITDEVANELGLSFRSNPGQTFHEQVDGWHCEVHLPTVNDAVALVNKFIAGEMIAVKGSQIDARRIEAIRSGRFSVSEVAKKPKQFENSCSHILANVSTGGIIPAGSAS